MKIKVLSSAIEDLYEGRKFYEKQREGFGEYFLIRYFQTLILLLFMLAFTQRSLAITECYPKDFPM